MSDLISRARQFATEAHQRIDHHRKYTHQPYQVHLKAVANLVAGVTDDPEMIAAAWLHDTVEDTPATFYDIEREFGMTVAKLVSELTDVSRPSDGNRAARKAIDRSHAAEASPRAMSIKLADLIDNCRDICKHDPRFAQVYVREKALLLEVLTQGDHRLYTTAQKTISKCKVALGIAQSSPEADNGVLNYRPANEAISSRRGTQLFLEAFRAGHIAESLRSFDQDRPLDEIAALMAQYNLAVAGLRQAGRTVGYVRRGHADDQEATVSGCSFSRYQIVDHHASLSQVIEVLTRYQYCFVQVLDDIAGVITRGDIQKPGVRMWLFGIITLFEIYMTEHIERFWPGGEWKRLISSNRLKKAQDLLEERRRRNQTITLLDCLQFSDKGAILMSDAAQLERFGYKTRGAAKQIIKEIEALRNDLAHAQDIVSRNWPQIARLARRLEESIRGE